MRASDTREIDPPVTRAPDGTPTPSPGARTLLTLRSSEDTLPVLPVAVAAALLALLAAVVVVFGVDSSSPLSPEPDSGAKPDLRSTPLKQANWRIRVVPANVAARVGRDQRRVVARQGRRLASLVREVYTVLFLQPNKRAAVLRRHFDLRTVRALERRPHVGVPPRAQEIRTTKRRARIVIDPLSPRRSIVRVEVRARGLLGEEAFAVRHRSILWLYRSERRWRVLAFDVNQRPWRRG